MGLSRRNAGNQRVVGFGVTWSAAARRQPEDKHPARHRQSQSSEVNMTVVTIFWLTITPEIAAEHADRFNEQAIQESDWREKLR